jgi:hypothetical protein
MKYLITIGEKVFDGENQGDYYKLTDEDGIVSSEWLCKSTLLHLGAKIAPVEPLRVDGFVEWKGSVLQPTYPTGRIYNHGASVEWNDLIGKRGKLVFVEEVEPKPCEHDFDRSEEHTSELQSLADYD